MQRHWLHRALKCAQKGTRNADSVCDLAIVHENNKQVFTPRGGSRSRYQWGLPVIGSFPTCHNLRKWDKNLNIAENKEKWRDQTTSRSWTQQVISPALSVNKDVRKLRGLSTHAKAFLRCFFIPSSFSSHCWLSAAKVGLLRAIMGGLFPLVISVCSFCVF